MNDNDPKDKQDGQSSLRHRLASAWKDQRCLEFYRLVQDDLQGKIRAGLRPAFRTLSDEDLDDCIAEAVFAFIRRNDPLVANPESYIWTSARNQARDLVEDRARAREVVQSSQDGDVPDSIAWNAAVILIEGLVEEVDAEPSWAVEVVQLAVDRLRPALKRTIHHVLANGTDCDANSAATALGVTAVTFRANKSNAYAALRSLVPVVMSERGIVPPSPRLADVFTERHRFAEDDS